jgi:hypothetical protein
MLARPVVRSSPGQVQTAHSPTQISRCSFWALGQADHDPANLTLSPTARVTPALFLTGFWRVPYSGGSSPSSALCYPNFAIAWKSIQEARRSYRPARIPPAQRYLSQAQRMHLAAPLFALDEIVISPRLMAPPASPLVGW